MRRVTFKPALTLSGRTFKGLRGYSGKPFHPPLTDVPVVAYMFAAVFDIISIAMPAGHEAVGRQLFLAASWTLFGGAGVSLLAALTGWADWHRSSEPGTQARRTINAHALTMIAVTLLVLADVLWRGLGEFDSTSTPIGIVILSALSAVLVGLGATLGGTLVFDYGFNVETAGDHPVWHQNEADVFPGQHS